MSPVDSFLPGMDGNNLTNAPISTSFFTALHGANQIASLLIV